MTRIVFCFFFILFASNSYGKDCVVQWENAYFQNLEATKEYNPNTYKMEETFLTFKEFKLFLPKIVSLNLPIVGDCSEFKIREVSSYRKLGQHKFVGEEDEHAKHGLDPVDLKFEDSPYEVVTPDIEKKKDELILKKFKIQDAVMKVPKGKRTWYMKFTVSFTGKDGIENQKNIEVKFPLTH